MTRATNLGLWAAAVILPVMTSACATPPPPPPAPTISFEQKMAWILQLEDQRLLRLPPAALVETCHFLRGF